MFIENHSPRNIAGATITLPSGESILIEDEYSSRILQQNSRLVTKHLIQGVLHIDSLIL